MTLQETQKIDSESMYTRYDEWPKIAEESYNKDVPKVELSDIDHVVFAGMGGIK